VKSSLLRLRLIALFCALLPGLLLTGSERVRVCLHAWLEIGDDCAVTAAVDPGQGCCASIPDSPSLSNGSACERCCIELSAPDSERSTPAPIPAVHDATFCDVPAPFELSLCLLPIHRERALSDGAAPATAPGRAPTPLRI
jgi:hypothetical protein